MEKLHPGAKWIFRIQGYFGSIPILIVLVYLISTIITLSSVFSGSFSITSLIKSGFVFVIIFIAIILIIIFSEIYARMAYNRWFYEFGHDGLKLERGIIWKRYSNIPYERIQNVDIHRGILARILGFSTLNIQTAGYSGVYTRRGTYGAGSEGHIPAVSIEAAEKIRNFLIKKISKNNKGNQGL